MSLPTPVRENPLWMPAGSVRGLLVFSLIGIAAALLFTDRAVPDVLWGFIGVAVTNYFRDKVSE